MGTLANISGKEAAKAFAKAGWSPVGQVGSHLVMTPATERISPFHSIASWAPGLVRALIRNSGMSVDDFIKLL